MRQLRSRARGPSSTRPNRFLPFEIINEVGEALTGNTKALQACSLACHAWNSAIRPLIFRSVTLSQSNVNVLEDLFKSIPTVGFWIQEVRIRCNPFVWQRRRGGGRFTGSESDEWFDKLPPILEVYLKRVHTFTFHHVQATAMNQMNSLMQLTPLLANLPTVTSINLLRCRIHERSLKNLFSSVPRLKNLHIHNCFYMEPWPPELPTESKLDPKPLLHNRPQLSSLRIHSAGKGTTQNAHLILKAIENYTNSSDVMSTFHLHIDTPFQLVEIGQYIGSLGPQIRHLNLALPFEDYMPALQRETDEIKGYFSLSRMTNLRSIHLHNADHPAVPHLLSTIEAPHLDMIVFTIEVMFIGELKPHIFAAVDEQVDRPAFASLREILFVYSGQLWVERVSQKLKKLFPSIAERDIIRVVKDQNPRDGCPEREDVV